MREEDIINKIKQGDTSILSKIYRSYKNEFVGWVMKTYSISGQDAEELFQFSVVTFYENIINKKLTELSVGVKTYLFAIGKNKALEITRKKKRDIWLDNLPISTIDDTQEVMEWEEERISQLEQLTSMLTKLSERCRRILHLFYYERRSMREIQEVFAFKTEAVAKNEKFKCQKKLKLMVNNGK